MLRDCDISPQQTTYLVTAGWLQRLSKGAYLLTGDRPTLDGILAYLSQRIPGLHVGGKTALDWQGVRHNVSFRERVVLWADRPYVMPEWIEAHMPHTPQTTRLFDDGLIAETALSPLPNRDPCPRAIRSPRQSHAPASRPLPACNAKAEYRAPSGGDCATRRQCSRLPRAIDHSPAVCLRHWPVQAAHPSLIVSEPEPFEDRPPTPASRDDTKRSRLPVLPSDTIVRPSCMARTAVKLSG